MALSRTFSCSPAVVDRILDEVRKLGAQVEGDESGGAVTGNTFLGHFAGSYSYRDGNLTLAITEKPASIPDAMLASRLDEVAKRHGLDIQGEPE
jgi:hypothetical protein